ncbi:MAG TPA: UvrD-helicase domain-containing protein [Acidimicrobiales bacterium]|nr:UvrD-helicase domain-containing protein [Acidimicrobiales bacterium]
MADEAVREAVLERLGETLFVEAGAGTGKTTALVGRIVELARRNPSVMPHVAAITFTEAAAAELRDRIRARLEAAATTEPALRKAVDELDEAAICTLHAFALRILTEHPVEAGLPPGVEVLDETRSALAFEERWRRLLDQLLDHPECSEIVLRGLAAGLNLDSVKEMARIFHQHWDRLEAAPVDPPALVAVDPTPVIVAVRAACGWLGGGRCTDETDGLWGWLSGLPAWAEALQRSESELGTLHLLANPPDPLKAPKGANPAWNGGIEAVREAAAAVSAARTGLLVAVRENVLLHLVAAVQRFTLDEVQRRQADGRLDFHDLLVLARDVVRDQPSVRASLRDRFSHVLIDEFQDTDPLQVELATLLGAGGGAGDRLEDGRLFFVGDAMQSIYRFRRADIRLFAQVRELVENPLSLTDNWRSVPGILEWVNTLFFEKVGTGIPDVQPAYQALVASRPALTDELPVVVLGQGHDAPVGAVREVEAAEVAATITRIRAEGWAIGSGTGQARLRDIAVLLPTRTSLPHLETALDEAGVPYRIDSASLVWGTQAVRDLLNALRAIDDPTDEIALVAALRSPLFGCGDDDLLAYHQAGGAWDLRHPGDSPGLTDLGAGHPVLAGLDELRRLHDQRWWVGVSAMVEQVMRELRCFELAFAHKRPRDHWRRLRWVLEQARAFEAGEGGTLRNFVDWAALQGEDEIRVREAALPESDDDAVRILTVHGAKGLEFPVVVLSGLNAQIQYGLKRPAQALWDENGRVEVRTWNDFRTSGYAALEQVERELDEQERLRLLYVAATRAEDHLVVSVHHPDKGADTQARQLFAFCEAHPHLWRRLEEAAPPAADLAPPAPPADPEAGRRRAAWLTARQARIDRHRRAPVRAATSIAETGHSHGAVHGGVGRGGSGLLAGRPGEAVDEGVVIGDTVDTRLVAASTRRGRPDGTSIGRAVHATLQSVDLATGAGLSDIAAAQAAAEGVASAAAGIAAMARAALESSTVQEAAAHRNWRELYVAAPIGSITLEGFVDLLYETSDGLVVVDYKTDAVTTEAEMAGAVARHRLQGAAYAVALEEALGRPVKACRFVFVCGGVAREREIEDLLAAMAEVRAILAAEQVA